MLNMSVCSFFRIPAFSFCQKRTFLIGERRRVCSQVGKNGHVKHVDANHLLGIEPTELARHSTPYISPVSPESGVAHHIGHETTTHSRKSGFFTFIFTRSQMIIHSTIRRNVDDT